MQLKGLITHFFKVMGGVANIHHFQWSKQSSPYIPIVFMESCLKKIYYLRDSDNVDELCESDVDQWMDNTRPCHPKFKIKNKLK